MVRLKLKPPQLYTEYVRSTATIVVLPGAQQMHFHLLSK